MAKSILFRRSAVPTDDQEFDEIFRRLLVSVSHIKLVAQRFGDLSSLSQKDAPAGLTLCEAAQDLDALYDDLDTWYVRHEHRPKRESRANAQSREAGTH